MQHLVEPFCSLIFGRHTVRYRGIFIRSDAGVGFDGGFIAMVRHLHTNTTGEIFSKWHSIRPRTCSHRDPTGLSVSAISIPADSRNPSHRIVTNAHGSRTAASPISGHEQKFSAFVDDSTLCFFNVQINSPMSWKLSTGSVSCLDSGCNSRRVFSSCFIRRWISLTTPEFQCFATAIRLDI